MKKIVAISLMCLGLARGHSQIFSWAKDYGNENSEGARSLTQDAAGNIFIFGTFDGSTDFGGSPNIGLVSNGSRDAFLLKTNASGDPLFALNLGGQSWDTGLKMVRDGQSNLTLGGTFEMTVDFNPGPGENNLTNTDIVKDQYVVRLKEDGSFVWANHVVNGEIRDLTVDESGNTYVVGGFQNVLSFFINGQTTNITTSGGTDIYIQKIDPSGNTAWVKSFGGPSLQSGYSIKLDSDGNIYCAGVFTQTADLDPSTGIQLLESQGEYDIFLNKLNGEGDFLWAKGVGGTGYDLNPLVTVREDGKVYLSGNLNSTPSINLYDGAGTAIWEKQFESPPNYVYGDIYSIVPDANNHFLITGAFIGTMDFDPSNSTELILSTDTSSDGEADCFLGYYDGDCSPIWVQQIGGKQGENGNAIDLAANNAILLLGGFNETLEIAVTGFNYFAQTNEESDIFLLKIQKDISGVHPDLMDNYFSLSPNPCSSYFEINCKDGNNKGAIEVVLLNLQGQEICREKLNFPSQFKLPADLPDGAYLVQLSSSPSIKAYQRIVVQK